MTPQLLALSSSLHDHDTEMVCTITAVVGDRGGILRSTRTIRLEPDDGAYEHINDITLAQKSLVADILEHISRLEGS